MVKKADRSLRLLQRLPDSCRPPQRGAGHQWVIQQGCFARSSLPAASILLSLWSAACSSGPPVTTFAAQPLERYGIAVPVRGDISGPTLDFDALAAEIRTQVVNTLGSIDENASTPCRHWTTEDNQGRELRGHGVLIVSRACHVPDAIARALQLGTRHLSLERRVNVRLCLLYPADSEHPARASLLITGSLYCRSEGPLSPAPRRPDGHTISPAAEAWRSFRGRYHDLAAGGPGNVPHEVWEPHRDTFRRQLSAHDQDRELDLWILVRTSNGSTANVITSAWDRYRRFVDSLLSPDMLRWPGESVWHACREAIDNELATDSIPLAAIERWRARRADIFSSIAAGDNDEELLWASFYSACQERVPAMAYTLATWRRYCDYVERCSLLHASHYAYISATGPRVLRSVDLFADLLARLPADP